MKRIFLILLIFNFLFSSKIVHATEVDKITLFNKCLQVADHPQNKTGGPDWDDLKIDLALSVCQQALSKAPNSIEVLRSLARVFYKQKEYKKTYRYILFFTMRLPVCLVRKSDLNFP